MFQKKINIYIYKTTINYYKIIFITSKKIIIKIKILHKFLQFPSISHQPNKKLAPPQSIIWRLKSKIRIQNFLSNQTKTKRERDRSKFSKLAPLRTCFRSNTTQRNRVLHRHRRGGGVFVFLVVVLVHAILTVDLLVSHNKSLRKNISIFPESSDQISIGNPRIGAQILKKWWR